MNAGMLRTAMTDLPPLDDASFWGMRRAEVRERVLRDDPAAFLSWPTIVSTMFVGAAPYVELERAALSAEWRDAATDTNMTHQAYHMAEWERATGGRVCDLRSVVEFGGGYGALALVLRRYGYTGAYAIVDFPEFALLQRYYLSQHGVDDVRWVDAPQPADLFIGLWSLNETDQATQARVNTDIDAPSVLLAYQNAAPPSLLNDPRWQWQTRRIDHLMSGGNSYAYGVK